MSGQGAAQKYVICVGADKNLCQMQTSYTRHLQHGPGHLYDHGLAHLLGVEMTLNHIKLP